MALLRRLQGYWLMIHPFPVTMVVTVAVILAVATARDALEPLRFVRAIAALYFSQVVVGISNDYRDQRLDAQGQPWKPLVRGILTKNEARASIAVALALMLAFAISLGPLALILVLLGTFAGLLYNFLLRDTPFSWLPYLLGFIVLPIYVWVAVERVDARQLALVPIGILLLLAVHLAQTIPDIETDVVVGARGLAVALGRAHGTRVVWSALIGAQVLALASALLLPVNLPIAGAALGVSSGFVVASIVVYHRNPTSTALRALFRPIALSAVILVAGWLIALNPTGR
jgi:4-hydroxybenzoate polyprenyltransferase